MADKEEVSLAGVVREEEVSLGVADKEEAPLAGVWPERRRWPWRS